MKFVFVLACVLAVACAQDIVQLTSGTEVTVTFDVTENSYTDLRYFWFNIPLNAQNYTITIDNSNLDGNCSNGFNFWVSTRGIPCGNSWSSNSDLIIPCRSSYIANLYSSYNTFTVFPDSESDPRAYGLGANLAIAVGRYSYYENDEICSFGMTATIGTCAAGSTGVYEDSSDSSCNAKLSTAAVNQVVVDTSSISAENNVYKFPIASNNIPFVAIDVNSTADDFYVIPWNYYASTDYYGIGCAVHEYYGVSTTVCPAPTRGDYYLNIRNTDADVTPYNVTALVFTASACPAGTAGSACNDTLTQIDTTSTTPVTVKVAARGDSEWYHSAFFYIDYPNGTLANLNVTFTAVNGSGYVSYAKDGFPIYPYVTSYDYETFSTPSDKVVTVVIRPEDTLQGGRFYIQVYNYDSTDDLVFTVANVEESFNPTTADTTAGSGSTTEGTSAASSIVASLLMIATMIAMLL
jgi:hypothetical protein